VSRQRARTVAVAVLVVLLGGCAAATTDEASEMQRLQARAAYERAVRSFDDKQPAAALTAAQEAVALEPDSALYHDLLGLVFNELLRPELGLEQFQRAVAIDPEYADARFHLGVALAEQRRWQDAVAEYRRAMALPRLTVPHLVQNSLGVALYNLKQYGPAEDALRFALRLQGRLVEARAAFREAQQLDPKSPFGQASAERLREMGDGG
jgi:Tfp pilus assembly protein PilF